jgi:hypothetical protein
MTTDPFSPDSAPRWKRRSKLSSAGQTSQSPAPDFYTSPEWWRLCATIMKALQNFPEARESVVTALRTLNALKDPDGPTS